MLGSHTVQIHLKVSAVSVTPRWIVAKLVLQCFVIATLVLIPFILQGCDLLGGSSSSKSEPETSSPTASSYSYSPPPSITDGGTTSMMSASFCHEVITSKSDEFMSVVKRKASQYYERLVYTFGEDYVKYPFCLETRRQQVLETARRLRGDPRTSNLRGDEFMSAVESAIQRNFTRYQEDYKRLCQDWTAKNIEWQTRNSHVVSEVLGIGIQTVEAEVREFFFWEPWWEFFEGMVTSGCMTKYTKMCTQPSRAARRHVKEIVGQKVGDPAMHWLYFPDNPSDIMGLGTSSLLQKKHLRRKVPLEFKAGGHMLLRH